MKRALESVVIAVSAILIVGVGIVAVRDYVSAGKARTITAPTRVIQNSASFASRGYTSGSENAEHTLVVFSDFDCPFCRGFAKVLDSLRLRHRDLRIVERHLPLTRLHAFAGRAALAAECARAMGKYEEMRNVLYERPAIVQAEEWGLLARVATISDTATLATCVRTERYASAVAQDIEAARRLGARGTPTVLLDSIVFLLPPTLDELESRVRGRLP